MKKRKLLIAAVLIALLSLLPSAVLAWNAVEKTIKVRFAQIQLTINGKRIETGATEPFIYNGSVYAHVATIANALGIAWRWDNDTPAVHLYDRAHQIMEENSISGHLQVYPLGDDYYYYYDMGTTYIRKGLKYQDKNSFPVTVPALRKEGYAVSDQFGVPLMEFIDLDRDGQKQELLVMYYLSPENREEAPAAYEVHVLRRVDERTLEDVGTLLNGKEAIRFHYQPEIGLLFATFYDPLFQPNRIEVFQWKQGRMEAVDTFVKAAGE